MVSSLSDDLELLGDLRQDGQVVSNLGSLKTLPGEGLWQVGSRLPIPPADALATACPQFPASRAGAQGAVSLDIPDLSNSSCF